MTAETLRRYMQAERFLRDPSVSVTKAAERYGCNHTDLHAWLKTRGFRPTKEAKPEPTHLGKTWRDMPGSTEFDKRSNFTLFKRGRLSLEYVEARGSKLAGMNLFGRSGARRSLRKLQLEAEAREL